MHLQYHRFHSNSTVTNILVLTVHKFVYRLVCKQACAESCVQAYLHQEHINEVLEVIWVEILFVLVNNLVMMVR